MAIEKKLKVTRDQFAEFIPDHSTIRQFERLFEFVNTLIVPPENSSNCFIQRYNTGWVANSDWTDTTLTVTHNLEEQISSLSIKFLISTDGTDDNSFEIKNYSNNYTGGTASLYGHTIYQTSENEFLIRTGSGGLRCVSDAGVEQIIDTESWYYKVEVTKLIALT